MTNATYSLDDLLRVMERLRDPESGCPWDLAQSFKTIVPSTLEECYELVAAIEQEDHEHTAEELGDVLFQVVFYSQLGSEEALFSFESVVDKLVEKLVRRHPHVFHEGSIDDCPPESLATAADVAQSWEAIKQSERNARDKPGLLADVPLALPALPRAQKLQKRAARVGFDWEGSAAVLDKLQEELSELQSALRSDDKDAVAEELGDVFFTCVNIARHLGLDAETSLRRANGKFEERFNAMEFSAGESGYTLAELDSSQLEQLWSDIKRR